MSDSDDQNVIDDDMYIIDDTSESLETFDLEKEEAAEKVEEEDHSPVGSIQTSGSELSSDDVVRLENENAELKDRVVRARADFENFRKRAEREKVDFKKYALVSFVRELLPVMDNFERALSVKTESAVDVMVGVDMIYKQLNDTLVSIGLKIIDEAPATFDPAIHDAVAREENPDVPSHTVTEVMQKGYMLEDRLIRPAMVKVAVGGEEENEAEEPAPEPIEDGEGEES